MAELGVKWKKADFGKGEQSQPVGAEMSSCPGGVHFELVPKPSRPRGFCVARLSESVLLLPLLLQGAFLLPAS